MSLSPRTRLGMQARRLLVVCLVYVTSAYVCTALTSDSDGVAPLYLAAGFALAFVIGWGPWMTLGIAAGSFLLTMMLQDTLDPAGDASLALVAFAWGVAAAVQAWLGSWLVRRFAGPVMMLERPGEVIRFLLLAGPVGCLVSATLSTACMVAAGVLPTEHMTGAALRWWAGDTLGVIVGTPMLLTLIGQPRDVWLPRRTTLGLPLALATVLLMAAIMQVQRWDRQREQAVFVRDATATANSVRLQMQGYLDAAHAVAGVFAASEAVTYPEFQRAVRPWVQSLQGVRAIGWHEYVSRAAWTEFEAAQRREVAPGYRLFDRGGTVPPSGEEVVAMRYVEPMVGNEQALGINVLSVPSAREAVLASRDRDEAVVSAPFVLTQQPDQDPAVVLYRAVHRSNPQTTPPRPRALQGAVFLALRIDEVLKGTLTGMPSYLGACMLDVSDAPKRVQALTRSSDCPGVAGAGAFGPAAHVVRLAFAGRSWELRFWPRDDLPLEAGGNRNSWLFAVGGVSFAASLGALLLVMTGRTRRIEEAVAERTEQLEVEIGERQRTESALRESEQRFRTIFDATPVGVIQADREGLIREANPGFCAIVGRPLRELSGMALADLVHPDDRRGVVETVARLNTDQPVVLSSEWRILDRNGRMCRVRGHLQALRLGTAPGIVCVIEDVTERQRLREAEAARRIAEASNRAKSEFLSRMSHELRTPLNAMLGFAQLMDLDQGDPLSDTQRKRIAEIERAGWHLLEMINDVLDLSRIEAGTLRLRIEALMLDDALRAAVTLVQPQAEKAQVEIQVSMRHPDLQVMADPTRLKQVLTNLLSNAVKYNRAGGEVSVLAEEGPGGCVRIEVADTGLGMTPQQLRDLFQPFNRLGRERSAVEGTGIGLVVSQRLVDLMGGTLRAASVEGQGTTFTLELPAAAGNRAAVPVREPLQVDPLLGYHHRRVLYIEDNETNAEVMRGIFQQRPQVAFEVCATGTEGLDAIHRSLPSLLLLDMHLPDMNGSDILRAIKADPATQDVPVVVVSADALPAQVEQALALGAMHYLSKPVNVVELLAIVDDVLGSQTTVW